MVWDGSILAAMVSPGLWYAGLGAASVPILIHLLSKRRFRRINWAAVEFLREAQRQNRRRIQIEELILLALRCLAMALAGLMLARCFLRPEGLAAVLGSAARREHIVLLDDSFSMALQEGPGQLPSREGAAQTLPPPDDTQGAAGFSPRGLAHTSTGYPREGTSAQAEARGSLGATVFDRSKSVIRRLVDWLRSESTGDSLTVLVTSRPHQPCRAEASVGEMNLPALREELQGLRPSYRGGNMSAAMEAVRQRLDEHQSSTAAVVYVVSDFQRIDWPPIHEDPQRGRQTPEGPEADSRGRAVAEQAGKSPSPNPQNRPAGSRSHTGGPLEALVGWAGKSRELRVVLVDMGRPGAENSCVTGIESENAQPVAGVSAQYLARVSHFGTTESAPRSMQVYVGDAAQPAVPVPALGPGQTVDVPMEITFAGEGSETLTVELEPDALPVDNTRAIGVSVEPALRILIVNGEQAPDPYEDEVFLLAVALRPEGTQFSGNEVAVISDRELETAELSNYHAVVLANVYQVTEESVRRLEAYAAAGGGVVFFLGDQVDPEVYNRMLYRHGTGLLPVALGEVVTKPPDRPGVSFGRPDETHPVMRRFVDTQVAYFAGALAWQYFACETDGAGATSRPTTGSANDRGAVRTLLRFDDPEGHPTIIERGFGQGRVILVTTSADKEWNNLADQPVYVILAMELIQYVARPPAGASEQLVGEPIALALAPARYQLHATLKRPTFPVDPAVQIDTQPDAATGLPVVRWADTARPGIYRFELTTATGGQAVWQVAVNVDPRESDLAHADRAALTEPIKGVPVEYLTEKTVAAQHDIQARRELWPALLIVLVMVLTCEQAVAAWFGSDRHLRSFVPFLRGARP